MLGMRVAVVGHVEYVEFLDVEHVPRPGEIVYAAARLACAAGGGAVAAVALARWAGGCDFYTALGDDELGHRAYAELTARGVTVHAAWREGAQRRAVTMVDAQRERTITVIGERHVAYGDDPLPWADLARTDGVYITGGDVAAVRAARRATAVVSTARILPLLHDAAIAIDALVSSAADAGERYGAGQLVPEPRIVVRTEGGNGGAYVIAGTTHRYQAQRVAVTGDTYGAGDTFAAGLTFALAEGQDAGAALAYASQRAAEVLAWHGPYPR